MPAPGGTSPSVWTPAWSLAAGCTSGTPFGACLLPTHWGLLEGRSGSGLATRAQGLVSAQRSRFSRTSRPSACGRVTRAQDPASRPAPAFVGEPRAPRDTLNPTRTQPPLQPQMRPSGRQREQAGRADPAAFHRRGKREPPGGGSGKRESERKRRRGHGDLPGRAAPAGGRGDARAPGLPPPPRPPAAAPGSSRAPAAAHPPRLYPEPIFKPGGWLETSFAKKGL